MPTSTCSRLIFLTALAVTTTGLAQTPWEPKGPWGGFVWGLHIDPINLETLYALMNNNSGVGVFKSEDGGSTWRNRSHGIDALGWGRGLNFLAMSPHDPQVLYAATNGLFDRSAFIYRSTDGAETWSLFIEEDIGDPKGLFIDPQVPGSLSLATHKGFFRSTDDGLSWQQTYDTYIYQATSDPFASSVLYAATEDGLIHSDDGGLNWALAEGDSPLKQSLFVHTDPHTPNIVYWNTVDAALISFDGGQHHSVLAEGFLFPLIPDRFRPGRLYASSDQGILISEDRGEGWTLHPVVAELVGNYWFAPLAQHPVDGRVLYAGTGQRAPIEHSGLYVTRDGGQTWSQTNRGLSGIRVRGIVFDPQRPGSVCIEAISWTGQLHLMRSEDRGQTWQPLDQDEAFLSATIDPTDPNIAYRPDNGIDLTRVLKTTDGGRTWDPTGLELDDRHAVLDIAIDPQRPDTVYAAAGKLFYSEDAGATWTRIDNSDMGKVKDVEVDPVDPRIVYAIDEGNDKSVFRTSDEGASWQRLAVDFAESHIPGRLAELEIGSDGLLYATTSHGLLASADHGESWRDLNGDLPPTQVHDIRIDPFNPEDIYIATESGVYLRSSGISAVQQPATEPQPQTFTLAQNHPNPFNSSTLIHFTLAPPQHITLTVYNLAGQRVATLADGWRETGSYHLNWDGHDAAGKALASGVYLYRLRTAEGQTNTRKLALIR